MKIAIYHTTDMHGYVFPTNYVDYQELGMLKILSFIKKDRENYDQSLLLDGGDLIQGSAMTSFLSKNLDKNNPIIQLLKMAEYDAYVFGNHEFNYGQKYLFGSYKDVEDKLLASNIHGLDIESNAYKIFDLNGYKIGVVGATTAYIPNWEQKVNLEGIEFENPVEAYEKIENEVREQSDYVIYLYHGGFEKSLDEEFIPTEKLNGENQASEMLEKFDSIDAILSGHQHRSFITKIKGVICSQPINNARNFTKLVIDTETNEVEYELVEVDSLQAEIDPEYAEIFADTNVKLDEFLTKKIGELDKDILIHDQFRARLEGHPFINILQKIQMDVADADFSTTTLFDSAIGFDREISVRDVLVNYPYPNILQVLEVTGHDLKKAMEISASYFVKNGDEIVVNPKYQLPKLRNYIYDFYYGLDYAFDISRPFGDRVVSMSKDGKEIDLDKTYKVVMNNYRASNVNEYPCYENKPIIKEIPLDMSELIINYFIENKHVSVDERINFNIF